MDRNLWGYVNLLGSNEHNVREEAMRILSCTCEYILSHPEEKNCRVLRFDDPRTTKLFIATGALECLFEVGFTQKEDDFFLPLSASLSKLQILQQLLSTNTQRLFTDPANKKFIVLPATLTRSEKKFFTYIVQHYRNTMRSENSNLQKKAKELIPIAQLQIKAVKAIKTLQKNMKIQFSTNDKVTEGKCIEDEIYMNDLFLVELLDWFKNTFFQWFDQPVCPDCKQSCTFEKVITPNDPQISRIEIYKCKSCSHTVHFPRYTDLEILLTSRCGRCGEWARTFTLLCRSLGYDARVVYDHTDHVWTEVWSMTDMRWIHMDPCENVIDRPFMYEKGWHKKLTYIIAFSRDEVQDVTWQYTRDQENVRKRRNLCSEDNLRQLLQSLNEQNQSDASYCTECKKYVVERHVLELAKMLYIPNQNNFQNNEEYEERRSGSYSWRLARGEVTAQSNSATSNIWYIPKSQEKIEIRYFIVKDTYEVVQSTTDQRTGWQTGMDVIEGSVFRKVEHDWKYAYLTCCPDCTQATVRWTFAVVDSRLYIRTFNLKATTALFYDGKISWELVAFRKNGTEGLRVPINDCSNFSTDSLKESVRVILTATLIGGKCEPAWQHAQLFRRSLNDNPEEPSMIVTIQLENTSQQKED